MDSIKRWLVPSLIAGVLAFGASAAQAARDVYPSSENVRTLNAGPAGWQQDTERDGPCVPVLLCPTVSNTVPSSGGAPGGYLRTRVTNFAGVNSTVRASFTSPAFTYRGVDGETPDKVRMRLTRIADVEAFLEVVGNSAAYSVQLVDADGGPSISVIPPTSLAGATDFTEIKPVGVEPAALDVGSSYRIRVVSTFESGTAEVIPSAIAGYDNIRLTAHLDAGSGSGNGNGSNGGNGANGGNGSNGANGGNGGNAGGAGGGMFGGSGIVGKRVQLKGDRLIVKVKCRAEERKRCRVKVQAHFRKRGPAVTSKRVASVKPGKKRKVALNVRDRYAERLATKKKVVLRQVLRRGGEKVRGYKRVRVKLAG